MVGMRLYVEGGGKTNLLRTECRQGFSAFLEKAGLAGHMPRVISCGSRKDAYDDFLTALGNGEAAMLLVDSEAPISDAYETPSDDPSKWLPWEHLSNRLGDQWPHPAEAGNEQCHLMVQCMEAWFLADSDALQAFFGQGFRSQDLPATEKNLEKIDKEEIYKSLKNATKQCKTKAIYGKGDHSFKLLALIDPSKVTAKSPWAKRFVDEMKKQMGC